MRSQRKGSNLKIQIRLALNSLGRDHSNATTGKSVAELEAILADLRREQIEQDAHRRNKENSIGI